MEIHIENETNFWIELYMHDACNALERKTVV